jgi:hypothetical protein
MKKSFRENIKNQLREKLISSGFRGEPIDEVSNVFQKSTGREEVTYTLYPTYFEVYERCYPAEEGWWSQNYPYTKRNIKTLTLPQH